MTDSVTIRDAASGDLPAALALCAQLGDPGEAPLPAGEAELAWARMRAVPGLSLRVAESGGRIVGTYTILRMPGLAHGGACSAVVENVVVDRRERGRGIGRILLDDAMEVAARWGCYKLALSSNGRRTDAHRFYERLGFRRHGISFLLPLEAPRA